MELRTAGELRSVLNYATEMLQARRPDQVQPLVLARLADVVGSGSVTLTHLDLVGQHEVAVFWPPRRPDPEVLNRYPAVARTHPLRRSLLDAAGRRTGTSPLRISDLLTGRAWRKTPIYQQCLRGVSDQMCLPMAFRGHQMQALTLARTSGSFTDRQHALLAACGAHVRAALDRGPLTGGTGLQLSPHPEWVSLRKAPYLAPPNGPTTGVVAAPPAAGAVDPLSAREKQVLALIAGGLTDAQVASRLGLRPAHAAAGGQPGVLGGQVGLLGGRQCGARALERIDPHAFTSPACRSPRFAQSSVLLPRPRLEHQQHPEGLLWTSGHAGHPRFKAPALDGAGHLT
jgi:hypothetical protein